MSLQSVLKTVGKDLSDVGKWVEDGLKIAAPIVGVVDPPLAPVLGIVENILGNTTDTINANTLQQLVTSVAATHSASKTAVPATTVTPQLTLIDFAQKLNDLLVYIDKGSK